MLITFFTRDLNLLVLSMVILHVGTFTVCLLLGDRLSVYRVENALFLRINHLGTHGLSTACMAVVHISVNPL